jgi:hypothetical protein
LCERESKDLCILISFKLRERIFKRLRPVRHEVHVAGFLAKCIDPSTTRLPFACRYAQDDKK